MAHRFVIRILSCALALAALHCDLPRDPEKTLQRVRGDVIRVGVSETKGLVGRNGDEATGLEADVVRGFAKSIGAKVEWHWGSQEKQLEALSQHDLEIVAGGLTKKSPWKSKVALTRPFIEPRVLAVPPGENAFLKELEVYLATHREEIHRAAGVSE
jgi:polar amino acid transport system substrate-binding protein